MNVVKLVLVNHFVVVMMIVEMVKFVKDLFVFLDVDQILVVPEAYHVSINNVLIHVYHQLLVEQMLNVPVLIIRNNVHVQLLWLVMLMLVVDLCQLFVIVIMIVQLVILVMEMFVKPLVESKFEIQLFVVEQIFMIFFLF